MDGDSLVGYSTIPAPQYTYTLTGLTPGTYYTLTVKAENTHGWSIDSEPLYVKAAQQPN